MTGESKQGAARFCAKRVVVAAGVFWGLWACGSRAKEEGAVSAVQPSACTDSLNPNGASELALLMRELTAFAEENSRLLAAGQTPQPWPESVARLTTAQATDEEMKGLHFDALAADFQAATHRFNQALSKGEPLRDLHNQIIGSCVACHQQSCAGPLVRIQKLFAEETQNPSP